MSPPFSYLKKSVGFIIFIILWRCSIDSGEKELYSTDIEALRKIVTLPDQTVAAKWEIFNSPKYDYIPGPADFGALVAEIDLEDGNLLPIIRTSPKEEYIVPQASRPWLPEKFRRVMAKTKTPEFIFLN